jgi:hypothetical protein
MTLMPRFVGPGTKIVDIVLSKTDPLSKIAFKQQAASTLSSRVCQSLPYIVRNSQAHCDCFYYQTSQVFPRESTCVKLWRVLGIIQPFFRKKPGCSGDNLSIILFMVSSSASAVLFCSLRIAGVSSNSEPFLSLPRIPKAEFRILTILPREDHIRAVSPSQLGVGDDDSSTNVAHIHRIMQTTSLDDEPSYTSLS